MKYSKYYCKDNITSNGYRYIDYDSKDNSYYFQKGNSLDGYEVIRCLESDIDNGNWKFMFDNNLTNTN